jgi:hypothetical protein
MGLGKRQEAAVQASKEAIVKRDKGESSLSQTNDTAKAQGGEPLEMVEPSLKEAAEQPPSELTEPAPKGAMELSPQNEAQGGEEVPPAVSGSLPEEERQVSASVSAGLAEENGQEDSLGNATLDESKMVEDTSIYDLATSERPHTPHTVEAIKSWTGVFSISSRPISAPIEGVHHSGRRFFTATEAFENWIMSREQKFHNQSIKRAEEFRKAQRNASMSRFTKTRSASATPQLHSTVDVKRVSTLKGTMTTRPTTSPSHSKLDRSVSPMHSSIGKDMLLGGSQRVPVSCKPERRMSVMEVMESQQSLRFRSEVFPS